MSNTLSAPALEIRQLEYCYRHQWTGKQIRALHPFSLEIESGEAFGFLGHNGAGKTTTIKAILNLITPTKGNISIFGTSTQITESRSSVGYVPEHPYFYDHLSVYEIVEMYAQLSGLSGSGRSKKILGTLERLGLREKVKSPMRSLSKGLVQRVAIAQAICHQPKLLILDEPFSGLDPLGRREIREIFLDLKAAGTTIFMSSHILHDVEHICDRVSILAKGALKGVFDLQEYKNTNKKEYEIVVQGAVDGLEIPGTKIATHEAGIWKLVCADRQSAELTLHVLLHKQIAILSYESVVPNLEDLFVKMTQTASPELSA